MLTTIQEKVTPIVDGLVTDIQTVLEENAETLEQAAAELQTGLDQIKQQAPWSMVQIKATSHKESNAGYYVAGGSAVLLAAAGAAYLINNKRKQECDAYESLLQSYASQV